MLAKKVFEFLKEGIGDKYLTKKYQMPDEFEDFETKYKLHKMKEKDEIVERDGDWILIKNPSSMNILGNSVRGVITRNGDLYIENKSKKIHHDILQMLYEKNILKGEFKKNWTKKFPNETGFLTVQRFKDTSYIAIGESNKLIYNSESWEENKHIYEKFLRKAQEKNPNLNFINKLVGMKYNRNKIKESQHPNFMRSLFKNY